MLTPEVIEQNYHRFRNLAKNLGARSDNVLKLIDHFGERLALCPASSRKDYHSAYPGGLVEHSLRVLGNAVILVNAFSWDVSRESLILSCLLHDIGKLGDIDNDLYVDAEQWKKDKLGELYTYNKQIPYMTTPDRSVWLCQHFNITLSRDEFLAIKLNDGQYDDANSAYKMNEPLLSIVVHHADLIATKQEKGQIT